jgi:hypothetical protein
MTPVVCGLPLVLLIFLELIFDELNCDETARRVVRLDSSGWRQPLPRPLLEVLPGRERESLEL